MMSAVLGGVLAALLALLLYQKNCFPFFWEDLRFYWRLRSYRKTLQARMKRGVLSYVDCFLLQARRNPGKAFIIFEEETLTYGDVDRRSNQFANVLRMEAGLRPGGVVALLMSNQPDFVCVWLGLSKLGCEVAFINTNIKHQALQHCLTSCGAHSLVLSPDVLPAVEEVVSDLEKDGLTVWVVDHTSSSHSLPSLLDKVDNAPADLLSDIPKVDILSNFLFIFTSGTTGLSKAARVGHLKAVGSMAFFDLCGATSEDIIYIPLPLYHMSASLLGVGGCIHLGATCVLKKKFSARVFWKDCVQHQVTVVQYIGELCRYLLHQPAVPEERSACVRLAAGSGLRSDVWKKFITRFPRIKIREGYGLTEASIGFINYTDEVGPIGRASYFNKLSMSFELLRCDPLTYTPVQSNAGRCIKTQTGEPGVLVAPLTTISQFLGYAGNKVQSEKKLLRDVFTAGDVYFNTGDLLVQDHRDFLYFHDRIGDTFRWKGENVSTTEVSEVLGQLDFIQEVNVYGVTVPGYEGRAGMAAVVLRPAAILEGQRLYRQLCWSLPAYAWPRFLRLQTSLDVTETFKQQKGQLVQDGFDPRGTSDPLFFLDASQQDFVPLTPALYRDVLAGSVRL